MKILGIESSCDDTSVALLECSKQGCFVIRESTASQIDIHKKYGGVVPEIAGRMHAEKIVPLIENVLKNRKPDAIAVASGPGLITGLIVGVEAARTLAAIWKIPLISVNHMAGHIHSVEMKPLAGGQKSKIKNIEYPALALIVSGGHTEIQLIKKTGQYKLIGATRDDAAGECFDKVAKLLDLPYPGGPQISILALKGNAKTINFPRPMLDSNNYDFSFAGLKTSALYYLRDNPLCHSEGAKRPKNLLLKNEKILLRQLADQNDKITINDFCASFEQAIVDTLVGKMTLAIKQFKPKTIILCGGVSANKKLRHTLQTIIKNNFPNLYFLVPEPKYCMDNATMVARAGYEIVKHSLSFPPQPSRGKLRRESSRANKYFTDWRKLKANPNWELGRTK